MRIEVRTESETWRALWKPYIDWATFFKGGNGDGVRRWKWLQLPKYEDKFWDRYWEDGEPRIEPKQLNNLGGTYVGGKPF